jgi:hypothetical protein
MERSGPIFSVLCQNDRVGKSAEFAVFSNIDLCSPLSERRRFVMDHLITLMPETDSAVIIFSGRARSVINEIVGPEWMKWPPSELAAYIAGFDGDELMRRIPNCGRLTLREINEFLTRYGHPRRTSARRRGVNTTLSASEEEQFEAWRKQQGIASVSEAARKAILIGIGRAVTTREDAA